MVRRIALFLCFLVLLAAESVHFGRRCVAGVLRLQGERAFLRNDHQGAWRHYRRAQELGGDRETLETDRAELLLFGLDQTWAGVRVRTALPEEEAAREALA